MQTINDVITGMIFYGIRLYMEEIEYMARKAKSTAVVMLNTRNVKGYQSVKEMQNSKVKGLWGNKISFLQVPIPKLSQSKSYKPLEFVWNARKLIKKKRRSFSVYLIGLLLDLEMKLKGPEVCIHLIKGKCFFKIIVLQSLSLLTYNLYSNLIKSILNLYKL